MAIMQMKHKVKEYKSWRKAFDNGEILRRQYGANECSVFRCATDNNDLLIQCQVNDLDRANQFLNSPDLQEAMKASGVISTPKIKFLCEE
jgi:hypothetical protein